MIELDIPQLSSDGIQYLSFQYTYSLQSSGTHSLISSSFDATGLENYISFGDKTPSSTSHVVRNRTELDSIPLSVEDLWIGRFDTTGITEFPFNRFQSLKSLVIGNGIFWGVTSFELKLSGLVRLKRIVIGNNCFGKARVFELDGLSELESVVIGQRSFTYAKTDDDIRYHVTRTDGVYRIVNCPKLKSIQIGDRSFSDYHSFELNNLPSLQSIDIGDYCFYYTPSFSLTGLID